MALRLSRSSLLSLCLQSCARIPQSLALQFGSTPAGRPCALESRSVLRVTGRDALSFLQVRAAQGRLRWPAPSSPTPSAPEHADVVLQRLAPLAAVLSHARGM